jgi:hypothetical protein
VAYLLWSKRLFGLRGGKAAHGAQRQSVSLLEVERAATGVRTPSRHGPEATPSKAAR